MQWNLSKMVTVLGLVSCASPYYLICLNFRRVKLSLFVSFSRFSRFTSVVAESQAGEIKPCISFREVKLSRMVADPRTLRKFNPAKVKSIYVWYCAMECLE